MAQLRLIEVARDDDPIDDDWRQAGCAAYLEDEDRTCGKPVIVIVKHWFDYSFELPDGYCEQHEGWTAREFIEKVGLDGDWYGGPSTFTSQMVKAGSV